ncbi:universal stress protein [Asanoa sp. NPDC049573]|uniref:universal stress protein n=1 Tax=Asanoa sp. NPDC049573 TaxID=3155396 RepID=UPI003437E566
MNRDTILVGYDGSIAAQTAADWALDEARRWSCLVRLVEVVEWPVRVGPATTRPDTWPKSQAYRDTEEALDRAIAALADSNPDVEVTGILVEGPPAAMLADLSTGVRMVVVGDHSRRGLAGPLLGSVATALATHAAAPVAVVRGSTARQRSGPVVVGVDDSPEGRAAVPVAFAEASSRDAELAAVHAWQPPRAWQSMGRPRYDDAVAELATAERTLLSTLLKDWRRAYPAVTVSTHVAEAGLAQALVEASRLAQLVVVGSSDRVGSRGVRSGSVSRRVLQHAHCPVLVIGAAENITAIAQGTRR